MRVRVRVRVRVCVCLHVCLCARVCEYVCENVYSLQYMDTNVTTCIQIPSHCTMTCTRSATITRDAMTRYAYNNFAPVIVSTDCVYKWHLIAL